MPPVPSTATPAVPLSCVAGPASTVAGAAPATGGRRKPRPELSAPLATKTVAGTGGAIVTVSGRRAVWAPGFAESTICTVALNVPGRDGVPAISPVTASSASPGGRAPAATDQRYGRTPPDAPSMTWYGTATAPDRRVAVVTPSGAGATPAPISVAVSAPATPATPIVVLNTPAAGGVKRTMAEQLPPATTLAVRQSVLTTV